MGSKCRIVQKLRQNAEYPVICGFLDKVGMAFTTHAPLGKSHPFITIRLPDGREVIHHINCTPKGGGNPSQALSKLRRKLRENGYDLGA